jgi:hypothetical protein
MIYLDNSEIEAVPRVHEKVKVEIEFLGRGVTNVKNNKHWAVLLKNENFFFIIEYSFIGILIHYFKKGRSIENVYAAMMGQNKCVAYNDIYRTNMTYAEILEYVNSTKSSWTSKNFNALTNNCQHFVRVLGKKMDLSFNPPLTKGIPPQNCPGQVDETFPNERIVA